MSSTHGKLTAGAADQQIKGYLSEIRKVIGPKIELAGIPPVTGVNCGDPNATGPHVPTEYGYYYHASGAAKDPRFLPAAKKILEHYTKLGWDTYGHSNKPSPSWLMRSPDDYVLSLTISPDGDLFGVVLGTPCVPKVATTFRP